MKKPRKESDSDVKRWHKPPSDELLEAVRRVAELATIHLGLRPVTVTISSADGKTRLTAQSSVATGGGGSGRKL